MFRSILVKTVFFVMAVLCVLSCEDHELLPYYPTQDVGKITIIGYAADSININANGKPLMFDKMNVFVNDITEVYNFVSYDKKDEVLDILNHQTNSKLHSFVYTHETPLDTISFFYKKDYFINSVLSNRQGKLDQDNNTGYKFIFPNMGTYSGSSYDGPVDAIIRHVSGQVLGIAENITKDNFGTFTQYIFSSPPVIRVELVKHGTNESYIEGKQIIVEMVMQKNKSKMIVLEETLDETNTFKGVNGSIDLAQYFDFQYE